MAQSLKEKIAARATTIQRGVPYRVGPDGALPELPERALGLSAPLQLIVREYLGAQKRSGEALLDAARWLSEARAIARHGEWQLFLEATGTSETTAKRLIDIHERALQSPAFAEGVRSNWLQFTVAAELAQPSTPPDLITAMIAAPARPSRADLQRAKAQAKSATVADLPPSAPAMSPALSAPFEAAARHARAQLAALDRLSPAEQHQLDGALGALLSELEQLRAAIRRQLARRS